MTSKEQKIEELLKKYEHFFQTTNADVTKSVKGKRFFYYIDDKSDEICNVVEFETATELEEIILHEIAFDLNTAIEVGIENINEKINAKNIPYSYCELSTVLNRLAYTLEAIQKECERWSSQIQNSLNVLCRNINDYSKKSDD